MTTVDAFLRSLVETKDWNAQFGQVRRWAEAGQTGLALEAAGALADGRRSAPIAPHVRRSLLEGLESALAQTPGLACAQAALQVALLPPVEAPGGPRLGGPGRQAAAQIAQAQPPETLAALFTQDQDEEGSDETRACLVQEMVLRGRPVAGAPADFWAALPAAHPLAWLPPYLLPSEGGLPDCLPWYGPQSTSWGFPTSESVPVPAAPAPEWTARELSDADTERIGAAVANWREASNGRFEARAFASDRPLTADEISPASLGALGLDCLGGATASGVTLERIPFPNVLAILFGAAANGGAYNSGHGGAYGRRDAWRSAAGLVGAAEGAAPEAVGALAARAAWFSFDADSGWFAHVAWDLGLLALRPDGRTLALLAATDTD